MSVLDEAVILNNGSLMPKLGLNVDTKTDLSAPLNAGYRLFSLNQEQITDFKEAINKQNILFQQLFLQLNINKDNSSSEIEENINNTLKNLGASYFDLVVLPASDDDQANIKRWQLLEKLKVQGRIKSIGVSDFYLDNLQNLLTKAKIKPVLDQINMADSTLTDFLATNRIIVEHELAKDSSDTLSGLAKQKKVSVEQLLLKYELSQDRVILIDMDSDFKADSHLDFGLSEQEKQTIANEIN